MQKYVDIADPWCTLSIMIATSTTTRGKKTKFIHRPLRSSTDATIQRLHQATGIPRCHIVEKAMELLVQHWAKAGLIDDQLNAAV